MSQNFIRIVLTRPVLRYYNSNMKKKYTDEAELDEVPLENSDDENELALYEEGCLDGDPEEAEELADEKNYK